MKLITRRKALIGVAAPALLLPTRRSNAFWHSVDSGSNNICSINNCASGPPGSPVVNNQGVLFNIPFNVANGTSIVTVAASNSPTSWKFTATGTQTDSTGLFSINNSGNITVTTAGAANFGSLLAGTFALGVTATNSLGSGAGTMTACSDGSIGAPTISANTTFGTITTPFNSLAFSSLLNYVGPQQTITGGGLQTDPGASGGWPGRTKGLQGGVQWQPPWNVAGIDYPVGINASAQPLAAPTTISIAGVTVDAVNHQVTIAAGVNATINGIDFSLNNGWQIVLSNAGTVVVQNCYFKPGSNKQLPAIGNCASFTLQYCVYDGNAFNFAYNNPTQPAFNVNAVTNLCQYNWFWRGQSEYYGGGSPGSGNQTVRFNVFGTPSYVTSVNSGLDLHGDFVQFYGGSSVGNVYAAFNMSYFDDNTNFYAGQGFSLWNAGDVGVNPQIPINSQSCSWNTLVNPLAILGFTDPGGGGIRPQASPSRAHNELPAMATDYCVNGSRAINNFYDANIFPFSFWAVWVQGSGSGPTMPTGIYKNVCMNDGIVKGAGFSGDFSNWFPMGS